MSLSMDEMLRFIRQRRAGHTSDEMLRERAQVHKEALEERAAQAAQAVLQTEAQVERALDPVNRAVETAEPLETAQKKIAEIQGTLGRLETIRAQLAEKQTTVDKDMEEQRKLKAEAAAYFQQLRMALAQRRQDMPYLPVIYEAGERFNAYGAKRIHPDGVHLPQPSSRVERFCAQRPPGRANRNGSATPAESGTSGTHKTDRTVEDGGRSH